MEDLVQRQHNPRRELVGLWCIAEQLTELGNKLRALHAADIAHLLEMLPPDERLLVWSQVPLERGGDVLCEVAEAVAESLIAATAHERLVDMLQSLDADDLGQIAELIPPAILEDLYRTLDAGERSWIQSTIAYPEDSVGHWMSGELATALESDTVEGALARLRKLDPIPEQTDKLFVVDGRNRLAGVLPLTALLLQPPSARVAEIMARDIVTFSAAEKARAAAQAFERYDLVSAPVLDARGKLLGRLTVDAVVDIIRAEAEDDVLMREGLSGDADLLAPVWASARGRWLWLALNLVTAFIASRCIGLFEHAIEQLVALATLMPIVASIGGNTGNQTIALFIRGLALDQINAGNLGYLARKEVGVSLINGALWGSVMGLVAFLLYGNAALALVMAAATLLNLVIAALAGVGVPLAMAKLGRDPALGSSVLLTFTTDSMGFFIFLGLATLFLLPR
ncbi:MAG: magnesium transporter [Gammaproteobacteria bacterium]